MSSIVNLVGAGVTDKSLLVSTNQPTTKDNIVACAIINAGVLPNWGGDYTGLSGTLVYNAANAADIARDAALKGSAKFFTHRSINGTRTETPQASDTAYGDSPTPEETGESMVTTEITYKGAWFDPSGFKALSGKRTETVFLFTNNTVEIWNGAGEQVSIHNVLLTLGGSSQNYAKGTMSISAKLDFQNGDYPIHVGSTGDIDTPVELTVTRGALVTATEAACNGDFAGLAFTTGGSAGTVPLSADSGVNCLAWELWVSNSGILSAASGVTYASIDANDGTITIPTGHETGTIKYIAVVKNQSGVIGQYKFQIIASA